MGRNRRRALLTVLQDDAGGGGASPSTVIILDEFTGADATAINGRAPAPTNTPGNNYADFRGTWQISANAAVCATPTDSQWNGTVVDAGDADVRITATVTTPGSAGMAPAIVCRYTDSSNYYLLLYIHNGPAIQIRKIQGGGSSTLAQTAIVAPGNGATFDLIAILNGNSLTVQVGSDTAQADNAFNNTATKHGIGEYRTVAYLSNAFDDFTVDSDPT